MFSPFNNASGAALNDFQCVSTIKKAKDTNLMPSNIFINPDYLGQTLLKEGPSRAVVVCPTKRAARTKVKEIKNIGVTCDEVYNTFTESEINEILRSHQQGLVEVLITDDETFSNLNVQEARYIVFLTQSASRHSISFR